MVPQNLPVTAQSLVPSPSPSPNSGKTTMNSRILVLACLSLSFQPRRMAATPPPLSVEYSADRRIESADDTIEGRVLAAPGMERGELQMGGMSAVMILRTRSQARAGW